MHEKQDMEGKSPSYNPSMMVPLCLIMKMDDLTPHVGPLLQNRLLAYPVRGWKCDNGRQYD